MKKAVVFLITLGVLGGVVTADIQSPPGDKYTPIRKLSRGVANIFYGLMEVPVTMERTFEHEGAIAAWTYGFIRGVDRGGARVGYGFYEVVNFRVPKYKNSFRPPYESVHYDTVHGYTEFPPQISYVTTSDYVRSQTIDYK